MKKLLKFIRGFRKESFFAPTFKMLEAIFELLVPLVIAQIIDVGIAKGDTARIYQMFGVMILLAAVGFICAVTAQYFAAKAAVGFGTALRSALFSHIQSFSYSTTDAIGTSTLITRMTSDINSVQTGVNLFLRLFMRSPFIVFGAMIMAFTISPSLSLIFLVAIILLAVVVFGIMLAGIPLYRRVQARLDRVLGKIRDDHRGARVIRAFCKQDEETEDFFDKNATLTKFQLFAGKVSALMNPLTYLLINLAVILLLERGSDAVFFGGISQGELIALYNYMSQILVELIKLASLIITLNRASASAKRISSVLDTPSDKPKKTGKDFSDEEFAVEFDKVSLAYNDSADPSISNISFRAGRGETVGIIGPTGCGKSSLVNLIPAFYTASEGEVFIGGKNVSLYDADELGKMIAIVPQKSVLFSGTVRSNLLWGAPDATDDEIWQALKVAQAKDFVEQKPEGLDTEVTSGGTNFSGGQRQRLTIARALLKKPKILILDDSASALDYATESALRRAIASFSPDMTTFIVSQRTSSISHADLILVLDDGELCGMGRHEDLLKTCELYREIYDTQFSDGGVAK